MTPPIVAERVAERERVVERERVAMPMGQLPDRARAIVVTIVAEDELKRPLLDLGLIPGTEVLVVRRAPLRDPIEVYVRGCHFSIRREEANRILVEAL